MTTVDTIRASVEAYDDRVVSAAVHQDPEEFRIVVEVAIDDYADTSAHWEKILYEYLVLIVPVAVAHRVLVDCRRGDRPVEEPFDELVARLREKMRIRWG